MSNEKLGAEQGRNDMERYGGSAVLRLCGKCSTPYPDYSMSSHIICWNCRNADHARGTGRELLNIEEVDTLLMGRFGISSVTGQEDVQWLMEQLNKLIEHKLREPGADTGTTPPPTTYKSIPYEPNGRCVNCAAADQLQCVLDEAHEGDCMFAEWPYRAATERGTTPPDEGLREVAFEEVRVMLEEQKTECLADPRYKDLNRMRADELDNALINLRALAATQRAPVEQRQPAVANIDLPRNEFEAAWAHYASTAPGTATEKNVFMAGWNAAAPDHAREGALRLECDSCGQDVTGEGYRPHRYVICHKPGCADKYTKNTLKLDKAISERRALADGKEGGE